MPSQFSANIKIADDKYIVNDLQILHFSYKVLWDRGIRLNLLLSDPDCALHRVLSEINGDPTPEIEFQLDYTPSAGDKYRNQGTVHRLNIITFGQVTTPGQLCIRIQAVDKASILLRGQVLSYSANGVKANTFIQNLAQQVGLQAIIPDTGDRAGIHRALRQKPVDAVRYELDRVLAASGKPISIQYDDRVDQIKLRGFEELYDAETQLLEGIGGGTYNYGVEQDANNSTNAGWGTVAYHYEMDQDFRPAIWGHNVSVDHLDTSGNSITGEVKAKLLDRLGIKSKVQGASRIHLPSTNADAATTDEYFAKAIMVNSVFQSEMTTTRGAILVDPDYKAFDAVDILNRKHLILAITGGTNEESKHSLIPNKAVIMGWEHRMNRVSAYSRVFLRRGN